MEYSNNTNYNHLNQQDYYNNLNEKQLKHLQNVKIIQNQNWQPCLHDSCPNCFGTGVRLDGGFCVHNISCPCPKCSPTY